MLLTINRNDGSASFGVAADAMEALVLARAVMEKLGHGCLEIC
ncbi:MAG: hypothetical protein QE263_00290 [Vampirovibrionales bacterium]|nr:hypothetical protein [Vampirovibrionales bacterium]